MQFAAQDDAGVSGVLTRSGTANANGTQLTVVVPALARTGLVRVVGDADTALALQIVPTLRAVGGALTAGSTLVLEGSGLTQGDLTLTIDGVAIAAPEVRTIGDRGQDQQVIVLTVPAGVSAGIVRVTTDGGTASLAAGDERHGSTRARAGRRGGGDARHGAGARARGQ